MATFNEFLKQRQSQPQVQSGNNMAAWKQAIANIESSGGNYSAKGPVLKNGAYKGDQALGKYQVMGNNIPSWSKAALGREVTRDEFLKNPALQDKIFEYHFGNNVKKYGSPENAAKVWLGGPGALNNPNVKDQLGTSVSEYGKRFTGYIAGNQAASAATQTPQVAQASGGFQQFLQQKQQAATSLPQSQPFRGPMDGGYPDEEEDELIEAPPLEDEGDAPGILKSLVAPAIGLGQDIAQWTGMDKRAEVTGAQNKQKQTAGKLAQRLGLVSSELDYNEGNAQKIFDRLQSSNIDDRQKTIITGLLNDSFNIKLLPPARTSQQAIGDILGTALMVVPVGHVFKAARGASLWATAARGGVTGTAIGAAAGMSEDQDLKGILKSAAIGGVIGAPAEVGLGLLGRGVKALAGKAGSSNMVKSFQMPRFVQSIGARLQKDFGAEGKEIYERVVLADNNALAKTGLRMDEVVKNGLLDLDDNAARRLTLALEGHIKPDEQIMPAFKAFDKLRREIAQEAVDQGVRVRVSGKKFSFAGLTEQMDSGDMSKIDVKGSKLGKKGATEVPFKARENFFRHYTPKTEDLKAGPVRQATIENSVANGTFKTVDDAAKVLDSYIQLVEGGGRKNNFWAEHLVKTGQAKNITEATGKTLQFFKNSRINRSGSLEKAREVDFPFYDPDARKVIPAYLMEATTRLEEMKVLGESGDELTRLLGKFARSAPKKLGATEGADKTMELRDLVNKVRGVIDTTPAAEKVNIFLRSLQIPKLAFAQVLNVGQNLNTLLASDAKSFFQTLPYAFSKESYQRALKSGATLESVMRESGQFLAGSNAGEKFLKFTGFSAVEKFNRVVAANVGINYAQNTTQKLLSNPASPVYRRRLQELGVNPESVLAKGGLSENELLMAGQKLAEITQFRSRAVDLPAFVQSPMGKTIFQFKSFAFQQGKFLKNQFKSQVESGDYSGIASDLFILATIYPMTGEVVADVRSLITGSKRPTDAFDRYMEDILMVGGIGLISDAFQSAGWGRLAEWMIGPTGGTAVEGTERLTKAVKNGEFEEGDAKFILNQTGFGRVLGNYLYPSDNAERETFLETLQDI